jgi:hypothetical protein
LQWTCKRCGLQRDDRRGSNCSEVKGQAHDWVETTVYEQAKWLKTAEGQQHEQKLKAELVNIENKLEKIIEGMNNWKKDYDLIIKKEIEELKNISTIFGQSKLDAIVKSKEEYEFHMREKGGFNLKKINKGIIVTVLVIAGICIIVFGSFASAIIVAIIGVIIISVLSIKFVKSWTFHESIAKRCEEEYTTLINEKERFEKEYTQKIKLQFQNMKQENNEKYGFTKKDFDEFIDEIYNCKKFQNMNYLDFWNKTKNIMKYKENIEKDLSKIEQLNNDYKDTVFI